MHKLFPSSVLWRFSLLLTLAFSLQPSALPSGPPLPEPQTELITNTAVVLRTNVIPVTVSTVTEVPRLHYYALYRDGHFSHVGRFGQEEKWREAYPHVINDPQLLAIISTPRPLHDPKTVCLP